MSKLIPGAIQLYLIYYLVRMLDPEDYGKLTLSIGVASFVSISLYQWLRTATLRYISLENYSDNYHLLNNYFDRYTLIILSTILLAVFILNVNEYIILALTYGVLLGAFEYSLEFYRLRFKSTNYTLVQTLRSISLLIILTVIPFYQSINSELIICVYILLTVTFLFINKNANNPSVDFFERKNVNAKSEQYISHKTMFKYGAPLTFTLLMSWVIVLSDRFIIEYFFNSESVGLYSAPFEIAFYVITMATSIINLARYPTIIKFYRNHKSRRKALVIHKNTGKLILVFGISIIVLIYELRLNISSVLFPLEYQDSAPMILFISALSALFNCYRSFYIDIIYQLNEKTLSQLKVLLASALLSILLNALLIPNFGIMGAAYGSVITMLTSLILSDYFLDRDARPDKLLKFMLSVSLVCVVTAFVLRSFITLEVDIIKNSLIFSVAYFSIILLAFLLIPAFNLRKIIYWGINK